MAGTEQWAPASASPWYHLGVWLIIYGLMFAAPSVAVAALMWLGSLIGVLSLSGEFYAVALVAGVSVPAVGAGWFLVRREQRDLRRLRDLDESHWL